MNYSLLYLETALHVSAGTSTHNQERIQLYLQLLVFVTPLLLPAAIAAGSSNGVTNTRRCIYSRMRSWWWVEALPETYRAGSRYNKLCNVASSWIYIGIFLRCTDPWTLKLQVHSLNMEYILIFHDNIGYANAPQCYFYLYITYLVLFTLGEVLRIILQSDTTVANHSTISALSPSLLISYDLLVLWYSNFPNMNFYLLHLHFVGRVA